MRRCDRLEARLIALFLLVLMCYGRHSPHRHRIQKGCSRCSPGQLALRVCDSTRNRNTECGPCSQGTYSPHYSYSRHCYLCARCGEGLYVAHACTPSRDTVCDSCHTSKGPHNHDFTIRCLHHGSPLDHLHHIDGGHSIEHNQKSAESLTWSIGISSAYPVSRGQVIFVLLASALASLSVFGALAALAFYIYKKVRSRKVQSSRHYSTVEKSETNML